MERLVNKDVIGCFGILLCLCTIGAVGNVFWSRSYQDPNLFMWNFKSNDFKWLEREPLYDGFILVWVLIVVLQVIIPQSLYVTLEMTKLIQIYLVQQDLHLYDEDCDKTIECRALNIPEELGQVRHYNNRPKNSSNEMKSISWIFLNDFHFHEFFWPPIYIFKKRRCWEGYIGKNCCVFS